MKRWFSILLALMLLAAFATPVLAAPVQPKLGPRGTFSIVGTIDSIDAAAGTVTVNVLRGNLLTKSYWGGQVTLVTTPSTRYLYKASATALPVPITFADLKVGDKVSVNGKLANNVWTANRITVGARLVHFP